MAYIYVIENDINDKKYIGKTNFSIDKRFQEHLQDYLKRRQEKRPLYNAINKYGSEHFSIRLLEEVSISEAPEREKWWITYYNSYSNGYNATFGGDGSTLIDYQQILHVFDTTELSQAEIAKTCNCSIDSVKNIVNQYRGEVDWQHRWANRHIPNNNGVAGKSVRCIETQQIFLSSTKAANWLISEGKITSQAYGRNKIPEVCRGKRKTCGTYSWEYV